MDLWSILGIITVSFVGYRFIGVLGKSIPVMEFMVLVAGLQWIVGPLIEYVSPSRHFKFYMYVEQEVYMSYVVPAYLLFTIIILLGLKRNSRYFLELENLIYYSRFGLYLVLLGVTYDLLSGFLSSIGFLGYIISNFKFVGAIILYFSKDKKSRKLFYFVILFLLYQSLSNAMFHDFILWSVFFYMFWAYRFKPSIKTILGTFGIAILFLGGLQTIKAAYRTQVWSGYSGNKVELFFSLMANLYMSDDPSDGNSEFGNGNNVRLNQGWIISAIMHHIPQNQVYLEGQTITEAIRASLIPRFLDPDKPDAGGRENFRKFTGLEINEGTSMGLSIVGEGYGNFGTFGGIVFMAFWGLFIIWIWTYIMKKAHHNILLISFIPLIFLQVVKAETELVVVLNHLVKSLIFILFFLSVTRKIWSIKTVYINQHSESESVYESPL